MNETSICIIILFVLIVIDLNLRDTLFLQNNQ